MPNIRNTGINSMSELFAMKKNMASQAKFDHKMSSITKDFYHKKYNMNQEIKSIFEDMREIQSSTGYTLDQVRSPGPDGRPRRLPNAPKLYLPPIGVRLVKKYVGIDIKRRKSLFEHPSRENSDQGNGDRNSLPQVRSNFRKLLLKKPMPVPVTITVDEVNIDDEASNGAIGKVTCETGSSNNASKEEGIQTKAEQVDASEVIEHPMKTAEEIEDSTGLVFFTAERRSSRSTYRKRASSRLLSRSDAQRQHNWQVITDRGFLKKSNAEGGRFFLDYGDGKLHTAMEIPKMKDCARAWCNPTCKTCQNRTTAKPCFTIIPSGNQDRQSLLLLQKRRASMFTVYRDESTVVEEDELNASGVSKIKTEIETEEGGDNIGSNGEENNDAENADEIENEPSGDDENDIESDDNEGELLPEIEKLLLINRNRVKKGYDKERIGQLAQPRGGHPAEVRFSKWSLRRKREQLKDKARTEQLSEREKDNLAMIQGGHRAVENDLACKKEPAAELRKIETNL